jgi:hypothetical protein
MAESRPAHRYAATLGKERRADVHLESQFLHRLHQRCNRRNRCESDMEKGVQIQGNAS